MSTPVAIASIAPALTRLAAALSDVESSDNEIPATKVTKKAAKKPVKPVEPEEDEGEDDIGEDEYAHPPSPSHACRMR